MARLLGLGYNHRHSQTYTTVMSKATENHSDDTVHYVSKADLPLSCPTPEMTLWNMHPKVYLPIEKTGEAVCPYCSAKYKLKG